MPRAELLHGAPAIQDVIGDRMLDRCQVSAHLVTPRR